MKLTIEISTSDLKRLQESSYGYNSLSFVLPVQDGTKAQKVKLLNVWKNPYMSYGNPKEARRKQREQEAAEQRIINSDIGDIEITIPSVYDVKFQVIKIEPSER